MSAALATTAAAAAPDAGIFAAVIVAAGVTALVALGLMLFGMQRTGRLNVLRSLATAGLSLGVIAIAVGGVVAVSPSSAQAIEDPTGVTYVVTTDGPDIQLPTLPLD
jgi:hypothetical protein